jgi:transposase
VDHLVARYGVTGLLGVTWQREEQTITRYVGPGRGGPNRPTRSEVRIRYVITAVHRDRRAIEQRRHRLGWRVQVTTLPTDQWSLSQAVILYRGGWRLERDFHLIKDRPLGISPLYVRRDDQIIGLTHLLTLGLRLLTLIETEVRRHLTEKGESLVGLYEGQPGRTTDRPTGRRLLKAFARTEITLTRIETVDGLDWHITPLEPWQESVLAYLGLPTSLYTRLVENSS